MFTLKLSLVKGCTFGHTPSHMINIFSKHVEVLSCVRSLKKGFKKKDVVPSTVMYLLRF